MTSPICPNAPGASTLVETWRALLSNASDLEPWDEPTRRPRKKRKRKPAPDGLRTASEAAARLGCSVKTLNGHVAAGDINYVAIGHGRKRPRKMFTDADLEAFIANRTRKDAPRPSTRIRARRSGSSTSGSTVVAFTARPNARPDAKPRR
jgi:hypothetical protein